MTNIQSAREFRADTHASQSNLIQIQFLNRIGFLVANATSSENATRKILNEICTFTTLEHGIVVLKEGDIFKVNVSQGGGLYEGSRVASSVAAKIQFKPYDSILRFNTSQHRLWPKDGLVVKTEWLLPIRINQQYLGFIALGSETETATLSDNELASLQTAIAMIGCYLQVKDDSNRIQDMQSIQLLTAREKEVFSLLPLGMTNAEIGSKLGITTGTAKLHVEHILDKLGLSDRTQAAVKASQMGFSR